MKRNLSSQEWTHEFQEFISLKEIEPPQALNVWVTDKIRSQLNPRPLLVFLKMGIIHGLVGTLNLLICPYSAINLVEGWGPMDFLMRWGESACMLACGASFLAGSVFITTFLLKSEEIQVIRKNEFLLVSALSFLSMGLLVCTHLLFLSGLFWLWLLGSILGGLLSLESSWLIRKWILSRP